MRPGECGVQANRLAKILFGISVALMSRIVSLVVGLVSGYNGGWVDRVLMSINDTFIVIPLFPILVLFYFVMKDRMSWVSLALVMACLGWAYDARLIRSVAMSLRTREFTETAIFSGMTARQILLHEHLTYVLPIVSYDIILQARQKIAGFSFLLMMDFDRILVRDYCNYAGRSLRRPGIR
jgi:ABC-type dipeptide/oligopeptide/nickel transport system permease subunit